MARECGRNAQEMESYRDIRAVSRARERQARGMINKGLKVPIAVRCSRCKTAILRRNRAVFDWVSGRTATFVQQVAHTIESGTGLPWKKQILLANWNYRKRVEV
jgi:hypothetical protein